MFAGLRDPQKRNGGHAMARPDNRDGLGAASVQRMRGMIANPGKDGGGYGHAWRERLFAGERGRKAPKSPASPDLCRCVLGTFAKGGSQCPEARGISSMKVPWSALPRTVVREAAASGDHEGGHSGLGSLGVVRPTTPEQVSAVMRWASEGGVPVAPVSSSQGGRRRAVRPPSLPVVALDLSRMDRLVHADSDDRIAVIEAGMTFGAIDAALQKHGLRTFKPLLPRRGKSVIAALLDREPITSPSDHWDTTDPFGGAEIVFASGERFHTGGASVRGDLETQLAKGARQMLSIGPGGTDFLRVVHGSQGTLGVVPWAAIYCEPIPAIEKAFLAGSDTVEPLVDLAYRVLWRRLEGQLFILNRAQLAMVCGPGARDMVRLDDDIPEWILYANLTAPDYFPEEKLAWVEADLVADAAAVKLVPGAHLGSLPATAIAARQAELIGESYKDALLGAHSDVFFLTQLDAAAKYVRIVDELSRPEERGRIGFYIQPRVQGVNCHFEIVLPFDPADPAAEQRAAGLQREIAERCAAAGGYFSRPRPAWSDISFGGDRTILPQLRNTKDLLDPAGILKPETWASFAG